MSQPVTARPFSDDAVGVRNLSLGGGIGWIVCGAIRIWREFFHRRYAECGDAAIGNATGSGAAAIDPDLITYVRIQDSVTLVAPIDGSGNGCDSVATVIAVAYVGPAS